MPRGWKNRILWNRRPTDRDAGDIDEIVIDHPTSIHVEQMDDRRWWIGIYLSEEGQECRRWTGEFIANSRGRMGFYEIECDLKWDRDEAHPELGRVSD